MERRIGKLVLSNNNSKIITSICGFRFSDFNIRGRIRLWKLAEYLEWIRMGLVREAGFLPPVRNYMLFVRAAKYSIVGDMKPLIPELGAKVIPRLEVDHRVSAIGKSSYTVREMLTMNNEGKEAGDVLVDSLIKAVRMNPQTRQPMSLGEDMLQLRPFCDGADVERAETALDDAAKKFVHQFVVVKSQIDFNKHVNQSIYLSFCEDTASLAASNGIYPSVTGDFDEENIKSFTVYYENECKLGDTIHVETWEAAPRQLKFRVLKDGKVLCFVIMTL